MKNYLKGHPYEVQAIKYQQFVSTYGTNLFDYGTFGGLLLAETRVCQTFTSTK